MHNLPVDTNDIYAQFGVSPKDYFIDPDTNTIKRKELPLPVEILQPLINDFQVSEGSKAGNKLFGTGGEERYQTWPERMVRSGSTIAGDVFSGAVPIVDPDTGHTSQPVIERAQDLAGMAGMSSIPLAPKGALGAAGGNFYSTLENTIAGSKVSKGTPEQWTSYLKNQPGVKPEELEFSLAGLPEKVLTKEELATHIADNGIKLGEVQRGDYTYKDPATVYMMDFDTTAKNIKSIEDVAKARQFNSNFRETFKDKSDKQVLDMVNDYHSYPYPKETKYSSYQLPGGENYRELLMTTPEKVDPKLTEINNRIEEIHNLPSKKHTTEIADEFDRLTTERRAITGLSKENYKSSHWDEPNVLAHIRMNDRDVPGVGKTLHVEEIQSDWHQAGRKGGYKGQDITAEDKAIRDRIQNNKATEADYAAWENGIGNKFAKDTDSSRVPNAPFKKTWDELALKRVLSEAANKGYDAVSWTPGEAQAARYDLSKQVKAIRANPNPDGTYQLGIHPLDNQHMRRPLPEHMNIPADKLPDIVGKELAEKIIKGEGGAADQYGRVYRGLDLKVGGEGMKSFYDKMLVDKANALVKKMGGKVEYKRISIDPANKARNIDEFHEIANEHSTNNQGVRERYKEVPLIKITPTMRETIANKGFPLYSSGVPTFSPVDNDPWNSKIKLIPVQGNPFQ